MKYISAAEAVKNGTSDSRLDWFDVGNYKKLPNEVGGMDTTAPEKVGAEMKKLLAEHNAIEKETFDDLLDYFRIPYEERFSISNLQFTIYI